MSSARSARQNNQMLLQQCTIQVSSARGREGGKERERERREREGGREGEREKREGGGREELQQCTIQVSSERGWEGGKERERERREREGEGRSCNSVRFR